MEPVHLEVVTAANGKPGYVTKRLSGKLALETVHKFMAEQRVDNTPHMILDLSGVNFLDSAGVGALVQLFVHRRNSGQRLGIVGLTQQGRAVLQVAGLLRLLPLYETVDAALAAEL
jgi:anti-sigma B factor antagonist